MTPDDARALVTSAIGHVAPEARLERIRADQTLQEGLGMDSIDFLDVVAALQTGAGIDIPVCDYVQLITVDGCVAYLVARTAGRP